MRSGVSACTLPATALSRAVLAKIREHTYAFSRELKVCGLMNVQYAVKDGEVYVLEVNPRASRTVPFVSKAIGVPLAKLAALCMAGFKLKDMGFTGEVMGIDSSFGMAFVKSQVAADNKLPVSGNVFLSVRDADKKEIVPLVQELVDLGFTIFATVGTSTALRDSGIKSHGVFRISEGRPNVIDMIEDKAVRWIVNTPSTGTVARIDEIKMRGHAVIRGIPITTTVQGLRAAIHGLKSFRKEGHLEVCSLQEYHRHSPRLNLGKVKKGD